MKQPPSGQDARRYYYSDEELPEMVERLNAFYDEATWSYKKAHREHKGLFGEVIREGEMYFRIRFGDDYGEDLKLSCRSMDRVLCLLFAPNPKLIPWADKLRAMWFRKKRHHIDKLRKKIEK